MKVTIALAGILANPGCHALYPHNINELGIHRPSFPLDSNGGETVSLGGRPLHFYPENKNPEGHGKYNDNYYYHLYSSAPDGQEGVNPSAIIDLGHSSEYLVSPQPPYPYPSGGSNQAYQFGAPHRPLYGTTENSMTAQSYGYQDQPSLPRIPHLEDPSTSMLDKTLPVYEAGNTMTQSYDYQDGSFLPLTRITHHEGPSTSIHDMSIPVYDAENILTPSYDKMQSLPDHELEPSMFWHHGNVNPAPEGSSYDGPWPTTQDSFSKFLSPAKNLPQVTQDQYISNSMSYWPWVFDATAFQLSNFDPDQWYLKCLADSLKDIASFPNPLTIKEGSFANFCQSFTNKKNQLYRYYKPSDNEIRTSTVRRGHAGTSLDVVLNNRQMWLQFFSQKIGLDLESYIPTAVPKTFAKIFPAYLFFVEMINVIVPRTEIFKGMITAQERIQEATQSFLQLASAYHTRKLKDTELGCSMKVTMRQFPGVQKHKALIWHFLLFWIDNHRHSLGTTQFRIKQFFNEIFNLCAEKLTQRLAASAHQLH